MAKADDPQKAPVGQPLPGDPPVKEAVAAATPEPAKSKPEGDGPWNNFGIEEPMSSDPDDHLAYDEKVADARAAYEKSQGKDQPTDLGDSVVVDEPAKTKKAASAKTAEPTAEDKPVGEPAKKPAAQTEAAALANDEKFKLTPDAEWTREQIVASLRERQAFGAELKDFRETFGMNGIETKKAWAPLLNELKEQGQPLVDHLETARVDFYKRQEDPEYAAFMDANVQRFEEWRKGNPGERPPAKAGEQTPEQKRIAQLESQIASITSSEQLKGAQKIIDDEATKLKSDHPILNDPELWSIIYDRSLKRAAVDPTYTLTRGVTDNWNLIQRFQSQTEEKPAAAAPSGLVRTSAATPTAARQTKPVQDQEFETADDAVAAFIRDNPGDE